MSRKSGIWSLYSGGTYAPVFTVDGAEYTCVIWEQSLSDVSGFENRLVRLYSQLLLSA